MTWTKKETELAKVVVDGLRARGWKVYQEVDVNGLSCDIVATKGRVLWAIECKISLGLAVLAQARGWMHAANLVSVAVLPGRRSDARRLAIDVGRKFGIRLLGGRHHYASEVSARGAIYKWAKDGKIEGVELIYEGKGNPAKLRLTAWRTSSVRRSPS